MRKYARWVHADHKDDNHYLINNIRTLGDHGEAGLKDPKWQPILRDINKVKSVKFMLCVFNIEFVMKGGFNYAAGHGQMIFEFEEEGVVLPEREVKGIVNSFEILPKEGESYVPSSRENSFHITRRLLAFQRWNIVSWAQLQMTPALKLFSLI